MSWERNERGSSAGIPALAGARRLGGEVAMTESRTPSPVSPMRRTSLTAGVLYLITFVSIPTLALYKPVKDHVGTFILGAGSDTGVLWGAASEVVVGLAGIGTAVVLFPVLKRQSESAAHGLVTGRGLVAS